MAPPPPRPPRRARAALALLVAVAAAGAAGAAEIPFDPPIPLAAGVLSPRAVVAADVDGDGDLDVLTASEGDDAIAWYENQGAPAFARHAIDEDPDGAGPAQGFADGARWVWAADLDGDGDVDALSASGGDDTIAWYENTAGDGSAWSPAALSTSAEGARAVIAADVNGDGRLDVVSASEDDDEIAWYENQGGSPPAFARHAIDEDPDGAGPAQGFADGARSVWAADLDGDGDVDVLSASGGDDTVAWYENTAGDGSAWSPAALSTSASGAAAVLAADLDGDGALDVLAAAPGGDAIAWYRNAGGAGSFDAGQLVSGAAAGASAIGAADVDGDGDLDVLAGAETGGSVDWYENTAGDGSSFAPRNIAAAVAGPAAVAAVDLDGDGDVDALSASPSGGAITWHPNRVLHRSAAFAHETVISSSADHARAVFAADLDGDGDLDALSASQLDDKIAWYANDGSGSFGPEQVLDASAGGAYGVFAGDLDGDGDADVLSAAAGHGEISWYENQDGAGSFGPAQLVYGGAPGASAVHAADLDGDGDLDAVSASEQDDQIEWYENTAGDASLWVRRLVDGGADAARWVSVADMDRDGDLDILSASAGDDKIAWYENDGATPPGFSARVVSEDPDGPGGAQGFADGAQSAFATDVDSDGDVDVLSASAFDDTIAWYENSAGDASVWIAHEISTQAKDAVSVWADDVDGDGDVDVLSASKDDRKVAWYENGAGDGSSWTEHVISTNADKAQSVLTADLDGDGDVDALSASRDDDKIAWYENRGGQFALPTATRAPAVTLQGSVVELLSIEVRHRGRSGDADLELAALELLFEEAPGDPLSGAEAGALVERLRIHRDDGSGTFDAGLDAVVAEVASFPLAAGQLAVGFADADPAVQVAFGAPATFFVAVELTADAAAQTPAALRLTHVTESSSSAEDRERDLPLTLEYAANASAEIGYIATPTSDFDGDGLLDTAETGTGVYVSAEDTGTDPFAADSDGDGWGDGEELAQGTDPNDPASFPVVVPPTYPIPALGGAWRALALGVLALAARRALLGRLR